MAPSASESEFDRLVAPERDALLRYLTWAIGHRDDALDALQEVLIRAYQGLPRLRDRALARSWLFKIASNVARDARRRSRRGPRIVGLSAAEEDASAVTRPDERPGAAMEAKESDEAVARALAALSPELREPLLLHVMSGLKYREVAEALGWPIGTVTTRIHVAREELLKRLRKR